MENNSLEKNILVIPEENIEVKQEAVEKEILISPEFKKIVSNINLKDSQSIMAYGNGPAEEITKFADGILRSMKSSSIQGSSMMIKHLTSIMGNFDKKDFEDEKPSFFERIFKKTTNNIDNMMSKYKTMGGEIDQVYTELQNYKLDINDANVMLEEMYNNNTKYYRELQKYVSAGNSYIEQIQKVELPEIRAKADASKDEMDMIQVQKFEEGIDLLKNKIYNLELAKLVALQTAPQIRVIQQSNYKLIGKIHSAFIITIPVFKNGILQAIALKRQSLISDSLEELDKTTNELLLKNSESIKNQSISIAKLSSGSSIKMETLEKTWQTIMEGIDETRAIEEENRRVRDESLIKINEITEKSKEKGIIL
ncbi:MAG: toxic anion resistance protein [Clostridium sp.]